MFCMAWVLLKGSRAPAIMLQENIGQSFGSMIQMLLLLNGVTKAESASSAAAYGEKAGKLLFGKWY